MDKYAAAAFGFFAFFLVWNRTVRWGYAVWVAIREQREGVSRAQLPVVLFVHSGPWLLGLYAFIAIHILSAEHGVEWTWFFGGAFLVPPVIALLVLRAYLRSKERRAGYATFERHPSWLFRMAIDHRANFICALVAFSCVPFLALPFFLEGPLDYWGFVISSLIGTAVTAAYFWYMLIWPEVSWFLYMREKKAREQLVQRP